MRTARQVKKAQSDTSFWASKAAPVPPPWGGRIRTHPEVRGLSLETKHALAQLIPQTSETLVDPKIPLPIINILPYPARRVGACQPRGVVTSHEAVGVDRNNTSSI